jgi:hypothetical protein
MQVAQKQTHGRHSEARNDNSLGIFKLHHYGDFSTFILIQARFKTPAQALKL